MMDSVDEFLRWGPYGLYATFVLMILALPIGWTYAYVAQVGRHRDITQPDPSRSQAAWGGALIVAALAFVFRHVLISSDSPQYPIDDFIHWMKTGYMPWVGGLFKPLLDYFESVARHGSNVLVRIFGAVVLMFLTPTVVAIALFGSMGLMLGVLLGAGLLVFFSFAFIVGALSAAMWCLPGFLLGITIVLYFLFVRLPLQVAYRRAIREGRWPTTDELIRALAKGTLNKTDWQSKIMAHKAQRFEASLDKEAARIAKRR